MKFFPWLAERGFISKYADYWDLPVDIVEDAVLVLVAEADARKHDEWAK